MSEGPGWALHLGDCIEFMRTLPDKSVDHVICDPPYEAEAHTLQRRVKPAGWQNADGDCVEVRPLDFAPITSTARIETARSAARIARRWILVFCQAEAVQAWREALVAGGAVYKRACVWVKPDGQPQLSGDRPGMGYESIVSAHAPGRSTWNGGGRVGVFAFGRQDNGGGPNVHPTQKPIGLMSALVRDFTDPGETILDPFSGSGTTGVACIRLGRKFIGCELDPKYHAVATRRLTNVREQLGLWNGAA